MLFFRKKKIESASNFLTKELQERKWPKVEGKLPIDIYENELNIIIQAAAAGVKLEDFNISIEDDMLEIQGIREKPEGDKSKKKYFSQECYWGPFSRKIILPKEVDNSRAQATMKEGILTIKLPKLERERKRRIRLRRKKEKSKEQL